MSNEAKSGRGIFFWLGIFAAVAVALLLIAKFLFPQLIAQFTSFLVGLFVVVTGLVFRRNRKST